ncbi:hypothetical protein [Nostoc sp.]
MRQPPPIRLLNKHYRSREYPYTKRGAIALQCRTRSQSSLFSA